MGNLDKLPNALLPELFSLFDLSSLAQFRTISREKQLLVDNQHPSIFQEIMSEPLTHTSNIIEIRSQIQKKINAIHYVLTVLSDNLKVQDLNHHLLKFLHVFLIKTAQILISNTNFNDYQTSITMHDIIRHLISSERFEEAIGISHTIPDDSLKDFALQWIVMTLTSTSFYRAIIVAHMIEDPDIRTSTLEEIDAI